MSGAIKENGRLQGRVAIVTGGTAGIGYAAVERMAEEGAAVLMTGRDKERGAVALETLSRFGRKVAFLAHDAGDETGWPRVVAEATDRFGALHVLVNNAYSGGAGLVAQITGRDLENAVRANLIGSMAGMRLASQVMAPGGAIVNIASIAALYGAEGHASYGAAKAALISLTMSAAIAFARREPQIRVNVIAPGYIRTAALETSIEVHENVPKGADIGPELERYAAKVPLGRIGEPRDLANTILFLASDEAKYITGQCLVVDGGLLIAPH